MKLYNFEIDEQQLKALKHVALDKDTSVANILRELIQVFLKKSSK